MTWLKSKIHHGGKCNAMASYYLINIVFSHSFLHFHRIRVSSPVYGRERVHNATYPDLPLESLFQKNAMLVEITKKRQSPEHADDHVLNKRDQFYGLDLQQINLFKRPAVAGPDFRMLKSRCHDSNERGR